MSAATAPDLAAVSIRLRHLRRSSSPTLLALSLLVAAVLALPLVFLLILTDHSGAAAVRHLLLRDLTAQLLWNTVRLTVVVTALCAVLGTATAWCIERTNLPLRRLWAVLVVVPLAIPDFVVSFGWNSLSAKVSGFHGAVLVMTLAVYPLVHLPVAASLRNADPSQEEMSRSLGVGRLRTFWRVTIGQARGAILGGCLLVSLVLLAEYGAFEILGYRTFTTEIFTEFHVFDLPGACALSLVLVVLSIAVVAGERRVHRGGQVARVGAQAPRRLAPHRLGRATVPVVAGFVALVGLAIGVPVGAAVYWMVEGGVPMIAGVSLASATAHTAMYAAAAGLVATLAALPVALLSVRHSSRLATLLERSTFIVLAMPGVVTALAVSYFVERYAGGHLYQTPELLVLAYAILFFPLALVAVRASVLRAPAALDDVARSLGRGRVAVFLRVTVPLLAPGLAAAFCLVFLSVVTELTATLILIPTGVQTLATQFWAYQANLSYSQAAPFALLMMGIAAVPSVVLGRWFDRSL
ncbi:MAG TPA: iron ABC transporter permease [Mycobacteriales bacterium]|nr:iron ABC transporter permease [Mycobacteriales bacterium]